MRVIKAFPPNYKEVNAAFNVRGKPVIFCYGNVIYNPMSTAVGPELIAHERVHSVRQGNSPANWWRRYIDSPEFRLNEEIPAHQVEFQFLGDTRSLRQIAERLSSPLYGNLVSFEEAIEIVQRGHVPNSGPM